MELLALQDLRDVEIEEVAVKDGLDAAGDDGDDVVEALRVVSVDPVEDVETAVGAESKEIMARDGLRLPGLADHEELGQDGDALQVDGEGPEDLHDAELVVENDSQEHGRSQEELHSEGVVVTVVGGFELEIHQIDGPSRAADEEKLHDGVVETDEVGQQVQISGHEHHQEQSLAFTRDSGTGASFPYFEEEEDNSKQVREVSYQAEQIHPVSFLADFSSLDQDFVLQQNQTF